VGDLPPYHGYGAPEGDSPSLSTSAVSLSRRSLAPHLCEAEEILSSIVKFMPGSGQVTNMSESARQIDVAAKFPRVALVHINPAIVRYGTGSVVFDDLARRTIIVSEVVLRVKRIRSRWKVQRRYLFFSKKVDVMRRVSRRPLRRDTEMVVGTGREQQRGRR
jgi:hypothetical protein